MLTVRIFAVYLFSKYSKVLKSLSDTVSYREKKKASGNGHAWSHSCMKPQALREKPSWHDQSRVIWFGRVLRGSRAASLPRVLALSTRLNTTPSSSWSHTSRLRGGGGPDTWWGSDPDLPCGSRGRRNDPRGWESAFAVDRVSYCSDVAVAQSLHEVYKWFFFKCGCTRHFYHSLYNYCFLSMESRGIEKSTDEVTVTVI